jgi:hypothetical protein
MQQVEEAMYRIARLPGANVDRGFGRGRDAVRQQLELLMEEEVSDLLLDGQFEDHQDHLKELQAWVLPYRIPDDYLYFIDLYGGLRIKTAEHIFVVNGFGPMCHEWYLPLIPEESPSEPGQNGLLYIGRVEFNNPEQGFPAVLFFIDLAGIFQQDSILGMETRGTGDLSVAQVIAERSKYSSQWKVLANSFAEWLELVVQTQGTLGYTSD